MGDWAESAVRRAEESGQWWSLASRTRPEVVRVLLARAVGVRRLPDKAPCLRYAGWAATLAKEIGEPLLLARALAERGNARRLGHDLPGAQKDLDRALALLPEDAAGADAAEVWRLQASLLLIRGKYEEGVAAASRARELHPGMDPDWHDEITIKLGLLLAHAEQYEEAQTELIAAIESLRSRENPRPGLMSAALVNVVSVWVLWLSTCRGPWRRAALVQHATDGLHHILPHQDQLPPQERPRFGVLRGIILLYDNKLEAARRQLARSIEELAAFREVEQAGIAGRWLLKALVMDGFWEEARALAKELHERFAGQGMEAELEAVLKKAAAARTQNQMLRLVAGAPRVHCGLLTD